MVSPSALRRGPAACDQEHIDSLTPFARGR